MTARRTSDDAGERGAILIQVAIALVALLALSAFVFDYGVMWTSRGQAQNSADAGALSGAQSLQLLEGDAAARNAATALATRHSIAGQNVNAGNVTVTVPQPCPPPFNTPSGCVKVDISKQDVPTFFARLANIHSQGVRATATAMVGTGNAVQCIKPWIVVDRWTDNSGTGSNTSGWDQEDVFQPGTDNYAPPGFRANGPGNDLGLQLALKGDQNQWSSGWSLEIELGGGNGGNTYRDEIAGCPSWVPTVGLYNPDYPCNSRSDTNLARGCVNVRTGVKSGPTQQGVAALIGLDPNSRWNAATNSVSGGCMATGTCNNPTGLNISPRIAPIAIFDPVSYANSGCSGNNCVARVTNLIGFFVEGMCTDVYPDKATRPNWCEPKPKDVVIGRLMTYPGQYSGQAGSAGNASFLQVITLVR